MPITQPPSPELAARAAALTHLPTNLSIKTQKPRQPFVGFAAGPALAAVQDSEEPASKVAWGSGEWAGEECDNAFWEEGAVLELASYDEPSTPFAGKSFDACSTKIGQELELLPPVRKGPSLKGYLHYVSLSRDPVLISAGDMISWQLMEVDFHQAIVNEISCNLLIQSKCGLSMPENDNEEAKS